MTRQWTTIWGNRSWKPLIEEGNHKCQVAWHWLQTRMGGAAATSIASALFSKLVLPYVLVKRSSDSVVVASMGDASWAALGWPVTRVGEGDDGLDS